MSRHPSFGKAISGQQKRSVLKRFERIERLRQLGKWDDAVNKRATGLPKTKPYS